MAFRVYLSGSMAGRPTEYVKGERELAVKMLAKEGMFGVDPAANEKKLWSKKKGSKIPSNAPMDIMYAFVKEDKYLIRRSDCLLVLTGDTPSDGTWHEVAYALKIEIPVVMISRERSEGRLIGWSNCLISYIVPDLKSAIKVIKTKVLPAHNKHKKFFEKSIKHAEKEIGTLGHVPSRTKKGPNHSQDQSKTVQDQVQVSSSIDREQVNVSTKEKHKRALDRKRDKKSRKK